MVCPDRRINHFGRGNSYRANNCMLKECPENQPYRDKIGPCPAFGNEESKYDENRAGRDAFHNRTTNPAPIPAALLPGEAETLKGVCPDHHPLLKNKNVIHAKNPAIC